MTEAREANRGTARLLTPRPALAGCIFAAIVRDTRRIALPESDRFNFFPASPLCVVSWFFEGESRVVRSDRTTDLSEAATLPRLGLSGPQTRPTVSWNPGPVFAMSVGFYPEAWQALSGRGAAEIVDASIQLGRPGDLLGAELGAIFALDSDIDARFDDLQNRLEPIWRSVRPQGHSASSRLRDWAFSVTRRAALGSLGQSSRQLQRRIKSWTGFSRQALNSFSNVEALYESVSREPHRSLAGIAVENGYADQSHMGREVRRVTGQSPARLNRLIATEESFWCYRLFGERF